MAEYASISLNIHKYPESAWKTDLIMPRFSICFIILDIRQGFEYALDIKYFWVLNMPRCSYNNIIIVDSNIILEFLSTRFVHPGVPQLTILSFF